MKKLFFTSFIIFWITACGIDCRDYPVGPYYRGTYEVLKEDKSVHFIGIDEKGNQLNIIIPPKYYNLTFSDSNYELKCHCRYAEK